MAELEWFPLYWQRFLLGTRDFTTEEVGAYFLLLLEEWDKGFLPESDKELKKISGISVKKLQNVMKKFKKIDGKYYNTALEIIRIEQTEKAAKYSERGRKGAEAKWLKQCSSNAQASIKQCLDDGIREEKREEEIRKEEKREEEKIENKYSPNTLLAEKIIKSSQRMMAIIKQFRAINIPSTEHDIKEAMKRYLTEVDARSELKQNVNDLQNHFVNWAAKKTKPNNGLVR